MKPLRSPVVVAHADSNVVRLNVVKAAEALAAGSAADHLTAEGHRRLAMQLVGSL
jgi:DNA-binding LacI/PurR family transcriptional regulator